MQNMPIISISVPIYEASEYSECAGCALESASVQNPAFTTLPFIQDPLENVGHKCYFGSEGVSRSIFMKLFGG